MMFMRFKFLHHSGILLAGLMIGASLAHAQSSDFEEDFSCSKKVNTFLSSFLDTDSAEDYWADFFERNRCQQDDIFAIDEEIDSLLLELYESSCETEEFTDIQREIREKKMELHFVRHIVEVEEDTQSDKDVEALDLDQMAEKLLVDMKQRYITKKEPDWVTEDELEELFTNWQEVYEDRIESYVACDDSPWQEVTDKTRELLDTMKEVVEDFKKETKAMKDEYEETQKERLKESGILNPTGAFASPFSAVKGYLKKHIALEISGLPSKQDIEEIAANFEALGQPLSATEAQQLLSAQDMEHDLLTDRAELIGRYTFLYGEGGSEIAPRLREKISAVLSTVQMTTSGGGEQNLEALQKSAKGIWGKQGKTSAS